MKNNIKTILITNDDGFNSVGIKILKNVAMQITENVFVVSPKKNQSAKSKSITIRKSINFIKKSEKDWIVNGTPTDCIIFALNHLMIGNKPDLILSGINAGSNVGDEVSYSGTVAAAWEGAIRGINSIAFSQFGGSNTSSSYECSKNNSLEVIYLLLDLNLNIPLFCNVNFPYSLLNNSNKKKFTFTKLASQKKSDEIILNTNYKSFNIGRMINHNHHSINSDIETLKNNRISITPLLVNLTNVEILKKLNFRDDHNVI